ncbi:MAG: diguanylate cyclase [Bdellovibrionales bacterium]
MEFTKIRNDFSVYVVDSDQSSGDLATEALRGVGYHVETFRKGEDVILEATRHPPHIILTGTYLMGMTGLQLLRNIKNLSPDIHVVFMSTYAENTLTLEAIQSGAFDRIYKPIQEINEIITTVDRVAEKMFLEASNEELYAKLVASRSAQKRLRNRFKFERKFFQQIQSLTGTLTKSKDTHELIQNFLKASHNTFVETPVAFFRYLPLQDQFILAQTAGLDQESLQGLQLELSPAQIEQDPDALNDYTISIFEKEGFEFRFLKEGPQVIGLFLFLKSFNDPFEKKCLSQLFEIFELNYQKQSFQKKLHENTIFDEVTGIYTKSQFQTRIAEEISRSRRLSLPVSVLHIGIDSAYEMKQGLMPSEWNVLVRGVAQSLKKTSRVNDIIARYSDHELVVILPHTDRMGAAIKAEKFRRFVERTQFLENKNLNISVTVGVSEYPTLSMDAENLALSADAAYFQVKKIGNKVCMASAPRGLQPDFEVSTDLGT